MRLQILFTCFAALASSAALAQFGNPGLLAPDTRMESPGKQAPNQTNTTDRLFAQLVTEGGLAEVAFGELAAEKAQDSMVGDFARRMIEDHSAANDQLAGIANKSKIPLPDALNTEHSIMRDRLKSLEGSAFDIAYMRGQVIDHQKTTQLLIWEIDYGQDPELKHFASEKLPTILEHLAMARSIVTDLAKAQFAQSKIFPGDK